MSRFVVTSEPLALERALALVEDPSAAGITTFLGVVRDHNDGRKVTLLEYEAYGSMAERQMARLGAEIEAEIPGVRLLAWHRTGALRVGDTAVICIAASAHRDAAFRACRRLIDRIKEDVPIWKREHGTDGPYWVGWEDARCRGDHHHEL